MKQYLRILLTVNTLLVLVVTNGQTQAPKKMTSGEIYQGLEKLNFLGSALYIAAHPDDENTRLISYLANEKKAFTTYLSLTRGDGGQNLIGSEISELLGVIRTQELLMARSVDHGHQMFTRANDFDTEVAITSPSCFAESVPVAKGNEPRGVVSGAAAGPEAVAWALPCPGPNNPRKRRAAVA